MVSPEQVLAARRKSLPGLLPPDTKCTKKGRSWMAICSFHEETTPSMSLVQYDDGTWGYRCFGCGATGDPIKYVQKTQGLDFADSVKLLTKEARTAPPRPVPVAEYNYTDENNNLLFQVLRYEPKSFRCRQKTEQGWSWCLDGVRPVLYRLPDILAKPDATIWYVEGEKDVETLRALGLVATTHRGGANSFRAELLDSVGAARRRFVVVPDMDEPGKAVMRKVYAAAKQRGHEVGFLMLPNPHCHDVTGHLESGLFTWQDLEKLVK